MGVLARIRNALIQRDPGRLSGTRALGVTRHAGVTVTQEKALTLPAVWAACRLVAESVAMMNWGYYEEKADGSNTKLVRDPLHRVLKRQANPEMTAFTLKQVMVFHALMWGNAYVEIERTVGGEVAALWPMLPDRTTPIRQGRALVYEYNLGSGEKVYLPARDVLHVKGLSFDGIMGLDVLTFLARASAIGVAMDSFQAAFFANGTHVSGGLFHPKTISKDAAARLREEFEAIYRGPTNAFRMGVFEEGLEWKSFQITPEASQMIEAKKLTITDLARFFRIPPHKLADLERATFSNIEEQNLDFVTDTMQPWCTRIETEADAKLIPIQYPNRYTKFDLKVLLRGRQKDRYEAYHIARLDGWMNADEIRALEEMPPLPDGQGKVYLVPVNMQTIDRAINPPDPPAPAAAPPGKDAPPGKEPPPDKKQAEALGPVIQQTWARICRRAVKRGEALAKLPEGERVAKLRAAVDDQVAYTRTELLPLVLSLVQNTKRFANSAEAATTMTDQLVAAFEGQLLGETVPLNPDEWAAHWADRTKARILEGMTRAAS